MIRLALVVPAGVAAEGADDVAVGEAADQEGEQELGGEGEHAEHVAQRPRPETVFLGGENGAGGQRGNGVTSNNNSISQSVMESFEIRFLTPSTFG